MSFKELGLSDPILRSLQDLKHSEPSDIQKQAIPIVLSGKNIMAAAQTGTGKTGSFVLPMIELLQKLIRIKSISPSDMGCFDLIENELKKLNFKCERINYQNVDKVESHGFSSHQRRTSTNSNCPGILLCLYGATTAY